jgi:hypothetical protein
MLTRFSGRPALPPSVSRKARPTVCVLTPPVPSPVHRAGHATDSVVPVCTAPQLHRRPLPTSFLDGEVDEPQTSTSTISESTFQPLRRVTLRAEHVNCVITAVGEFFLVRQNAKDSAQERIACQGSVTLPKGASEESFSVGKQRFENGHVVEAEVTWGPSAQPLAKLKICSPCLAAARFDWCKVAADKLLLFIAIDLPI